MKRIVLFLLWVFSLQSVFAQEVTFTVNSELDFFIVCADISDS